MIENENLNYYLQAWNLSDPQPLTETVTSHLYTVQFEGTTTVLKLLTDCGWEEQMGALALRCYAGRGAIRLYQADEKAQLLEYVEGEDLVPFLDRGEDETATQIIASVLTQLHSAPQPTPYPDGLFPLRYWFRDLFKKAEADKKAGIISIYVRGAATAEALLTDPRDIRLLHGDIHHANIRHSQRGWLAFDPKGLVGERTYDTANTLCNLIYRGNQVEDEALLLQNAAILAEKLGIELTRMLAFTFAYACLSGAWYLPDEEAAREPLTIAEMVEPHMRLP